MAEETPKTALETTTTHEEAVVHVEEEVKVTDVTLADKNNNTEAEADAEEVTEAGTEGEAEKKKHVEEGGEKIADSDSFKEESTKVSDLSEAEKKGLQELKQLIQEALNKHEFSSLAVNLPKEEEKPETLAADANKEQVSEAVADVETKTEDKEHVSESVADDVATEKGEKKEEDQPAKIEEAAPIVKETYEPEKPTKTDEKEEEEALEVKETKVEIATVDEDGAKTVEAIEETIVAVSSSTSTVQESSTKEEEEEASAKEETSKDETSASSPPLLPPEEVSIWGIPLLSDERSDVILLKFLRARDFKVKEAFTMIKNTIKWRNEFGIDELLEQENLVDDDLEKVVYMHGFDKEGHPVCYNIYGEFQNKEVYKKTFSDEEKREKFLRWRIQFLERSIRKLDFTPGGISTLVQVNDLKNSPGPGKWELRQATKQALQLLQDNYPEFVAKQVFINVPWWYLAVNRMISPFLTQRTKSKFVFAGPSKSAETLLRYIAPEQLPVKYGGLSKDGEFGITDTVTEITVKPASKHNVEFPVTENCQLSWELRVIGWDISYGAEFVPSTEGSYTVIIQKDRKVTSSEEPVIYNSYKIGEPGKVVLTIDNQSSKKKKLLYRLKTIPNSSSE
ncbi:PREDICTED: patellin-3-like isoform X1 [Lupinus angustifolius]|uniref:patellin-3-like isoform X1 n=1 Tax=Lupinus angustifolius TaxID=3871 RepID=UPI00092F5B7E|nr:PREDICTED: patellin-3-like isoform X1 [Lupinus angustifolius]